MYFVVVFFQVKISTIQLVPIQVKISILNVTPRYSFIKFGKTSLLHKFANLDSLKNVEQKGEEGGMFENSHNIYNTVILWKNKITGSSLYVVVVSECSI